MNPPESWIRQPAPDLRIIDDALWTRAQARKADLSANVRKIGRPAKRLLSGLLRCGVCGGGMTTGGQPRRYRCSTRVERGSCTNAVTALAREAESRVLTGLQDRLLAPDAAAAAVRAYAEDMASASATANRDRLEIERELLELQRRIDRSADSYERACSSWTSSNAAWAP